MMRAAFLLPVLLALLVGCAGPSMPPPLRAPTVTVSVDHYQGTPLSGPRLGLLVPYPAEPSEAPVDQSLVVVVSVLAGAGVPDGGMLPLTSVARVTAMPLTKDPLRSTLPMLRGGRIGRESGRLAQARELVQLGSVRGALDLGMTATIAVRTEQRPDERLILLVHRPPDDGALALHLALLEDGAAGAHESWQQALIAAAPMRGGESVLIQLPLENGCGMLMFELSVAPPRSGDLAHRVQVDRARSQASAHLTGLRRMLEQVRAGVPDQTGVIAALAGLKSDEARRAALLHVAAIADAGATRDLALTGRPDLLHEVADGLSQRIPQGYDPTIEELAWLCEQESLTAAARRVESEVDEPVLEALLLRHTGEVGRNLPLVLGLLDAADGLSDLRARLLAENLLYLDDTSPASRVRAFDWLLLRGLHPQDYNPLGSRVERRAALARHVEAAGDAP